MEAVAGTWVYEPVSAAERARETGPPRSVRSHQERREWMAKADAEVAGAAVMAGFTLTLDASGDATREVSRSAEQLGGTWTAREDQVEITLRGRENGKSEDSIVYMGFEWNGRMLSFHTTEDVRLELERRR